MENTHALYNLLCDRFDLAENEFFIKVGFLNARGERFAVTVEKDANFALTSAPDLTPLTPFDTEVEIESDTTTSLPDAVDIEDESEEVDNTISLLETADTEDEDDVAATSEQLPQKALEIITIADDDDDDVVSPTPLEKTTKPDRKRPHASSSTSSNKKTSTEIGDDALTFHALHTPHREPIIKMINKLVIQTAENGFETSDDIENHHFAPHLLRELQIGTRDKTMTPTPHVFSNTSQRRMFYLKLNFNTEFPDTTSLLKNAIFFMVYSICSNAYCVTLLFTDENGEIIDENAPFEYIKPMKGDEYDGFLSILPRKSPMRHISVSNCQCGTHSFKKNRSFHSKPCVGFGILHVSSLTKPVPTYFAFENLYRLNGDIHNDK